NQTAMQVVQVNEPLEIRPNEVYVIPPDKNLMVTDGHIEPAERESRLGAQVTVDLLFRSLADSRGRNGVGIILSGTGSDGTIGVKHLKEKNGFAIVQDPGEAEFDEMPENAISTKLVDWVLPVTEMPRKLIAFR